MVLIWFSGEVGIVLGWLANTQIMIQIELWQANEEGKYVECNKLVQYLMKVLHFKNLANSGSIFSALTYMFSGDLKGCGVCVSLAGSKSSHIFIHLSKERVSTKASHSIDPLPVRAIGWLQDH